MAQMEKFLPVILIILLTIGGIYIERSIFSTAKHWMTYGLGIFVFLLWVVAMVVIGLTYKDLQEVQIISSSTQVIKLTE
jgi:hypothetical protein